MRLRDGLVDPLGETVTFVLFGEALGKGEETERGGVSLGRQMEEAVG